jgi:hypothetical protein
VLGEWELATIDGVGPGAAAPLRVPFPAGVIGSDTVVENGMWHEYTVDSLVLTLEAGGSFHERLVEARRTLVQQNTFERPEYVSGAFGGDLLRADAEPATIETAGTWALAGDSLVLTEPPRQRIDALVGRLRQALPSAPAGAVQAAVTAAVVDERPRWTGRVRGERLELLDRDGHVFALRRPAAP